MTATEQKGAGVAIEDVMGAVFRLQAAIDTLVAIGARAGTPADAIDADLGAAMDELLAAAGVPSVEALAPEQRAMVAATVRTVFGQAADLLAAPERPPGWAHTDVAVLEGQGRASMMVPTLIAQTGEFTDVGSFLDVGTGVGWLAVAAAAVWPDAEIVGVDTWPPSLERARTNVAGAGLADRVEVREQSVVDLDDVDRFDLTWVPSFYVSRALLDDGFAAILRATRPGGRIVVGCFDPPPDDVARAAQRLRTVRDGGANVGDTELAEVLAGAGWTDVRTLAKTARVPLTLVAARKPQG